MNKTKDMAQKLVLLLFAVIFCVFISEIVLRVFTNADHYFTWVPNYKTILLPAKSRFPGITDKSEFKVNSIGVRGREIQPNDSLIVLAVGGSTTECLYLDQDETWQAIFEKKLNRDRTKNKVWVGNIGKSGLNAYDNYIQLKYVSKLPHLDILILMVGINDLLGYLAKGSIHDVIRNNEEVKDSIISKVFLRYPKPSFGLTPKNSFIYKLVKDAFLKINSHNSFQDDSGQVYGVWRKNRKLSRRIINQLPDLSLALDKFEKNIDSIIVTMTNRADRIIFLTQTSMWRTDLSESENNLLWMGGKGDYQKIPGNDYYSVKVLDECLSLYNKKLLEICKKHGVECLDVSHAIPKNTSAFYDDVHFNEGGARILADLLFSYFNKETSINLN